jgi:altronate dehydratase
VILSEITEFLGTEQIVAERCATPEVRDRLLSTLEAHAQRVKREAALPSKRWWTTPRPRRSRGSSS